MNKLVIELSGFGVDRGREKFEIHSVKVAVVPGSGYTQPCQKTHADGDNALSRTIMLQIYIPKAIEQSC